MSLDKKIAQIEILGEEITQRAKKEFKRNASLAYLEGVVSQAITINDSYRY